MSLADKIEEFYLGNEKDEGRHFFLNTLFLPTTEHFISYRAGELYRKNEADLEITVYQLAATFWGGLRNTIYLYNLNLLLDIIPEKYKTHAYTLMFAGTIISCAISTLVGYFKKNS
ncbi:MAG: hypothetical protein J7K22_01250 [Nanoarchaeota archaeon]|nr:hypothetical protein [Nanoarchaeota archaeon]